MGNTEQTAVNGCLAIQQDIYVERTGRIARGVGTDTAQFPFYLEQNTQKGIRIKGRMHFNRLVVESFPRFKTPCGRSEKSGCLGDFAYAAADFPPRRAKCTNTITYISAQ